MKFKEKYGYFTKDLIKEFAKFDKKQNIGG